MKIRIISFIILIFFAITSADSNFKPTTSINMDNDVKRLKADFLEGLSEFGDIDSIYVPTWLTE